MITRARPRVAVAIASPGVVTRREMQQLLADADVVFEEYRVAIADAAQNRAVVGGELQGALGRLAAQDHDALVLIGVAPSVALGPEREGELRALLRSATERPTILAMDATLDAFDHLGLHDAAIIAPLAGGIESLIPRFFAAHGITVATVQTLGLANVQQINDLGEDATVELAERAIAAVPDAACVYSFGGGLATLGVLTSLQTSLHRPVFSSNTATAWATRNALGLPSPKIDAGALFPSAGG